MSFAAPALLALLLAIPLAVVGYVLLERQREKRAGVWASAALLPNMVSAPPPWRRHLPIALLLCGVALLLVGFARPRATVTVKNNDATMIVVLDVSGSMAATDSQPSRIAVARVLANRLVDALPKGYRISVVLFSDHVAVAAPPTTDLVRVRAAIATAKAGPQGTALGEAIAHAIDVAHAVPKNAKGTVPPAAMVVFSDGGSTAGTVNAQQAAVKARAAGIPVSTVALGTPNGVVTQKLQGGLTEQFQVPVEPQSLQAIAKTTGGRFFSGAEAVNVKAIDDALGSRAGHKKKTIEVTAAAAGGGMLLIVFGAGLSGLWFRRLV
ncbi:MAG TPA: VWA domain-containing protein [Gaiellaceae bacterium]